MKMRHTISALTTPLLSLTIAISASSFAAAPDNAGNNSAQRDRAADTTLPGVPDRAAATAQEARERGTQEARGSQEAQGRASSQQPRDTAVTPGQDVCENSHAPTGAPGLANNENAQGGNPQANENARGSRADENQSEQGAENSRADIAQGGDDCLPAPRQGNENARGQGTGTNPGNSSGQIRDTQD